MGYTPITSDGLTHFVMKTRVSLHSREFPSALTTPSTSRRSHRDHHNTLIMALTRPLQNSDGIYEGVNFTHRTWVREITAPGNYATK